MTKAITIRQPHASLVALGVKQIETRSWATTYRGPLAIHAAKRCVAGTTGEWHVEDDTPRRSDKQYLLRGPAAWPYRLPLGAVVATCELVDVVPIGRHGDWQRSRIDEYPHEGDLPHQQRGLWLTGSRGYPESGKPETRWHGGTPERIEDQRPYGDFAPGRFAWLLGDVKTLDKPIPATGRQGLWEWER